MATAIQLFTLFVNRADDYLIQLPEDHGYSRVDSPLTPADLARHLEFEKTITIYQLNKDSEVKWLCFDLDGEASLEKAKILQKRLEKDLFKNATLLEDTGGRGHHIWCFLRHKISAKVARNFCADVLKTLGIKCEYYPKQEALSKDNPYGSAVRLPCGLHTKYQKPSRLLNPTTLDDITPARFPEDLISEYTTFTQDTSDNGKRKPRDKSVGNRCSAVRALRKGVSEGARDIAAFALARFYVDKGLVRDEIETLLSVWNNLNEPPLLSNQVKKCIRSATQGKKRGKKYSFGCNTFSDPAISHLCEQNKATCGIRMQMSKKNAPLGSGGGTLH